MIHLKTAFPRARRDHQCEDFLLTIERGTVYRLDTFKDDYVYDWRSHPECHEESVRHVETGESWKFGFLFDIIDRADWSPEYAAWYDATHAKQTRTIPAQCDGKPPETLPEHTES